MVVVLGAALHVDRASAMFGIIIRHMIALLMRIIHRARARLVSDCLLSSFSPHIIYTDRVQLQSQGVALVKSLRAFVGLLSFDWGNCGSSVSKLSFCFTNTFFSTIGSSARSQSLM